MTPEAINTHGVRMKNGKFGPKGKEPGMLITRVPTHYLVWMVNDRHHDAALARAELERRGTSYPEIEVSGHSVDRASLSCRHIWHQTRQEMEGLHSWLLRVSKEALATGITVLDRNNSEHDVTKVHLGMKFAFAQGEEFPKLKTIIPIRAGLGKAEEE